MSFTAATACLFLLGCVLVLVVLATDDEEWLDPTDMLLYDGTSKTMRRQHKRIPPVRSGQDPSSDDAGSCQRTLYFLQEEIESLKHKANDVIEEVGLNLHPESKLARLLSSIQNLSANEEDFHRIPRWYLTSCVKLRRYTTMLLDKSTTAVMELAEFMIHLSEGTTLWLMLPLSLLPVFVLELARRFRKGRQQRDEAGGNENVEADHALNVQDDAQLQGDDGLERNVDVAAGERRCEQVGSENDDVPEQQELEQNEECYDENFEITKKPTPETRPADITVSDCRRRKKWDEL